MEHRSTQSEEIEQLITAITIAGGTSEDDGDHAWRSLHIPGAAVYEAQSPLDDEIRGKVGRRMIVGIGLAILAALLIIAIPQLRPDRQMSAGPPRQTNAAPAEVRRTTP